MNFRLVARMLGALAILVGLTMAICWLYAYIEGHYVNEVQTAHAASWALGVSTLITLGVGIALYFSGWRSSKEILRREAIVIVGLSWILTGILGGLPYYFCDPGLDFIGSVFESVSGFTTTGSSVMTDVEAFPRPILMWRSMTQWLGGIGILVVFVAVLSFLGVGSRSLVQQESSVNISDAGASRIRDLAASLVKVYLVLTILCMVGLLAFGMNLFESICHAMTTIATGGFSPKNRSVAHYGDPRVEIWLGIFMFLSALSFMFYVFLANRRWNRLKAEEEARYYFYMIASFTVFIAVNLVLVEPERNFAEALREAFFNVTSISSTTGFGLTDYDQWPLFSRMLLMALMLIGGCAGSTAGGLKMTRIILFIKISHRELVRAFRPTMVFRIRLNGVAPDDSVFVTVLFLIALGFSIAGLSVLAISLLEPAIDLRTALGAVFATLWNVGPGFEAVGPTDNFAFLHPTTLVLLSFLMILGRLEFFALLVLFIPSLWKKY